jgi:3-oxoacyl-[acyl-carrier-protein] synthase II
MQPRKPREVEATPRRRVVVTGMGVVTSLGGDLDALWAAVLAGRSGVSEIRQFDSRLFPIRIGSEVPPELVEGNGQPLTRATRFGLTALRRAWRDAGLAEADLDPWRSGLCIGCSSFPVIEDRVDNARDLVAGDRLHTSNYLREIRRRPDLLSQRDMAAVSALLAADYPLRGFSATVQAACTSATQAIGEAFAAIRHGEADLMVTGGTDSLLSIACLTGFTLLGALSSWQGDPSAASRPFDRKRDGFVLGEGAGLLILEDLEHACARGAPIRAEVVGYGSTSDGFRFTDMHPEGLGAARCMAAALADAGLAPEAVDYVNAHGTSTSLNDRIETLAIKRVLGDHAYRVPVSSNKSQLGHLICAAGGVELILTVLTLERGVLPPTINLDNPDPECDLDYVPNRCRPASPRVALSNSFGFGGQNGTLVVRRWEGR